MLITTLMMKRFVLMFAALGLLFACTPEENNTGDNNGNPGSAVHVTGISLDRPTATIKEGESITLVSTVTPANAANKNVTWATSSEAVATVDNNGKVTGVKAGSATITATTEDGGKKATCALTVEANLAPSVTGEANHVSAISAVLAGKANLGSSVASDLKVGFQYSKSAGILPSNSTTVEATDADENYNYTTSVTGLEPSTTYYFRSFVRQNGQDTYGETKSFKTKDVASLLETNEASDVEAEKATLNAKLDLTDVQYESLAYGFLWGSSEAALNTDFKCTDIKDNAISTVLTNLSSGSQYWYKVYVQLDSQTLNGEVKTFTTVQWVTSITLSKTSLSLVIGEEETISVTSVLPDNANDKTYTWSSSDNSIASVDDSGKVTARANGNATIRATANDGSGVFASCSVVVFAEKVDMGIKTSDGKTLYWSTRNLCESGFVNSPEEYGDYYAWGETAPYYSSQSPLTWKNGKSAGYIWASYKWCNGSYDTLTKYNTERSYGTVDNKTVLNQEDDVASVTLGGKWRMPTDAEWTELRTKCTWTWTTNYNGTGVKGRIVTATNGNSIFLPAAGRRYGSNIDYVGYDCNYWSLSLRTDEPSYAWAVTLSSGNYFDSENVFRNCFGRYYGLSVRPVSE